MKAWLLKRLAQAVVTIWAVITITFAITRFLPGGPVDFMKARLIRQGQTVDEERLNQLAEVYTNVDPDQPLHLAYVDYISRLASGNMGQSIYIQEPVSAILADTVPWTVFFMSVAVTLMFAVGILFGAAMAYAEGSKFDSILSTMSTVTMSVPYYIFAVLFLYYFGFIQGWFPTGGRHAAGVPPGFNIEFFRSALWHAVLPAAAIIIPGIGAPALQMRGNSIQVLGQDYLRVASLRGLPGRTIATRYVGRNAILPMYTNFLIRLGIYFGGAVILEEIFTYRGVGFIMFQAIETRDYSLMMGSFIVLTTAVVLAILLADLTYGWLDPRVKAGGGRTESTTDEVERSVFETEVVAEVSRTERLKRFVREYIVASILIMWDNWRTRVGGLIILFYILMGTVGTRLVDEPSATGERLVGFFETSEHPLGTDSVGVDLLGAIVHATPDMLIMITAGALFTTVLATIVGTVAGYKGGRVDRVLSTLTDIAMSIPGLPLVIVLAFILEPRNPAFVGVVVSVNAWAGLARSIRSQVLTLRGESYVEASRAMGISTPGIITKDLLPNLMPYILVNFTLSARRVIIASVALYFLGILPVSSYNWGFNLNQAYNSSGLYSLEAVHWFLVPTVTIVVFIYGLVLFGQAADRLFNPQARVKHMDTEANPEQ